MPLLQVRDCPEELYTILTVSAKRENRSIAQQTVFLLKNTLAQSYDSYKTKRSHALSRIGALGLSLPPQAESPADALREERDRTEFPMPAPLDGQGAQ